MREPRYLVAALICFVLAIWCLSFVGCTPAPRCETRHVGWTDYDAAGRIVGTRTVPVTVCR